MRKCSFAEYRTWVMINLLLNSGMRAATLRNILIKDLLLDRRIIVYRHNKNKTIQTCPLCSEMIVILKEYLKVRGGSENDYLFPCEGDTGFTENGLRLAIVRYNKRRGVQKTSIHLFQCHFAAGKAMLFQNGNKLADTLCIGAGGAAHIEVVAHHHHIAAL